MTGEDVRELLWLIVITAGGITALAIGVFNYAVGDPYKIWLTVGMAVSVWSWFKCR
jgi:hypothetical protein